jgi:hypothetical protein
MEVIWKDINTFEGLYQISNLGKVRNSKGKILKGSGGSTGYIHVVLVKDKIRKTVDLHRITAISFLTNSENYNYVNHIDGNKLNNCVENLEWCTARQNTLHATLSGLKNDKGENSSNSKLTYNQVLEIKNLSSRLTNRELGKRFGVSGSYISLILNNRRWSYKEFPANA